MTAIVAIVDAVPDQVEEHLCRYDAAVVGCELDGHTLEEDLNVLALLLDEVFQRVDQLGLLLADKHVHRFGDRLHLFLAFKLNVPKADPLALLLLKRSLILSTSIGINWGAPLRPSGAMLRHLGDATVAAPTGVGLDALDVQPERVGVKRRLEGAMARHNAHLLDLVLLLQVHLECLINQGAALQCFHVPLVLFSEDGLWDQEIRQLVGEDVHLELDTVR